jgi:hypothetical protein
MNRYPLVASLTDDGSIIAALGYNFSDREIVEVGNSGELLWSIPVDLVDIQHVRQAKDGSILVAGSLSMDGPDAELISVSEEEGLEWRRVYGGNDMDKALLVSDADKGYRILGTTSFNSAGAEVPSLGINSLIWMIRIDENGYRY